MLGGAAAIGKEKGPMVARLIGDMMQNRLGNVEHGQF
jgi:hypothetical protein